MFGRLRWLGTGVALGAGATVWAQRKARTLGDRYRPARMMNDALDRVSAWPGDVRAAVSDGRRTMRQTEAELRQANEEAWRMPDPAPGPARSGNGHRPGSERPWH